MVTAVAPEIALRSRSPIVRRRYIETTEQAAGLALEADLRGVLDRSVAWLEVFHISVLVWEYIHEHEIRSLDELRAHGTKVDQYVRSAFPDARAAQEHVRSTIYEDLKTQGDQSPSALSQIEWSQIVRSFDAVVAECPIEELEQLGKKVDEPALAHRARNAYDALRAFVRRHDPARAQVVRIVGDHYRRGHLALKDAASLLDLSTSDTVFEMEHNGFSRSAAAIALTDDERDVVYQRLREGRLQRSGAPVVNMDLVERDVIASERIEGVDARAWIRRR